MQIFALKNPTFLYISMQILAYLIKKQYLCSRKD